MRTWCSCHRGITTSLFSFTNFVGPKADERFDYKLALLVYKCQLGAALSYLTQELSELADLEA